jgi:colanic acid/amylovoran biosynthesis glycosyltransferase
MVELVSEKKSGGIDRLGYLFERFPSFTQTFCAREIAELYLQGVRPPVFSIRQPKDDRPLGIPLENIPVFYLPDTNSLEFKLKTKLISPQLTKAWSGSGDLRDKSRFREALYLGSRLRKAGVTHLHVHFAGLASRTAWWIKRLFGIPYSFTGHANDIFCPKPDQRTTLKDLIDAASFVVTVSDYSAGRLRRDFPNAKIFRVYNGLDLSLFRRATPKANPLKMISVGRLIEKKGFPYLIEACDQLRTHETPFTCEIIGDGPDREQLEQLIRSLNLEGQVRLLGPKTQPEIIELLAQSSLFVFPAIHDRSGDTDNLPTVLIEAMASGLPIVATNIAGIPEIVRPEENGLLVPEKDSGELGIAIQKLQTHPEHLQEYGAKSVSLAEKHFSLSNTVAQLAQIFDGHAKNSP